MNSTVKMKAGGKGKLAVKEIVAWNPETKKITSGPAKGQTAKDEQEAISIHKAALAAGE